MLLISSFIPLWLEKILIDFSNHKLFDLFFGLMCCLSWRTFHVQLWKMFKFCFIFLCWFISPCVVISLVQYNFVRNYLSLLCYYQRYYIHINYVLSNAIIYNCFIQLMFKLIERRKKKDIYNFIVLFFPK